jgi:phage baseplate assembly protein gpV
MSEIAAELRRARREDARLNRRIAMLEISGPVAQRDPKTGKVRLTLGQDPDGGTDVLSPWVRVQSSSAGAFKSFVLPSIGEQMVLHSASGTIGAESIARFGGFTGDVPGPEQEADENVIASNGTTRLSMKAGELRIANGDTTHVFTAAGLAQKGGRITHDGKSIGSDHKHGGVLRGAAQTDPPI